MNQGVAAELTCAICGWEGRFVGLHANKVHGISAAEYRARYGESTSETGRAIRRDLYEDIHGGRYWTRERVLAAGQRWVKKTGRPPTLGDWRRPLHQGRSRPNASTVLEYWPRWNDFLEALGCPRREPGTGSAPWRRCAKGHDLTDPANRAADGRCRVCAREYASTYQRRWIKEVATPNATCEECGAAYYRAPSRADRSRFCSRRCTGRATGRANLGREPARQH